MEQVRLGGTGLRVSSIILGMMSYGDPGWRDWVADEAASRPFVERALEIGITTFDTADTYSRGVSEEVTGRLLWDLVDDREDVVVATKCFFGTTEGPNRTGLSRKSILAACDASLRRLGTDYIDLYQIHRWDPNVPIEETMGALHTLVEHGKVRYLGASSMHAWQFAKAQRVAAERGWTPFVSMQPHHNLLYREEEREMIPQCVDMGVGVIPWSPLARGRLARPNEAAEATTRGKSDTFSPVLYDAATEEAAAASSLERIVDAVGVVAERHGATRAQVALAWSMGSPGITAPIIGASKLSHLDDALAASELTLTDADRDELEGHYLPRPVLGHG